MIIAAKGVAASSSGLPYRWVAAGISGYLGTTDSTSATTWTTRTSSFGTTQINDVKSNGVNMWVAVGDAGKLATSPDGITWTQRTSSFGTTNILCIAYGNGIWVAGGTSSGGTPKFATATDPTGTWTQRTSGFASGDIDTITFGNGLWAAISSTGEIRTATDPTSTWTLRTSTLTASSGFGAIRYCAAQNIWVAGFDSGTTGALASSTDGQTWTSRDSPTSLITSGGGFYINNNSVIAATIFKTGPTVDIITSTNGTTWTDRTPGATASVMGRPGVDGNGLMVLPFGLGNQTSTDGTTWTANAGQYPNFANVVANSAGL